MMFRASRQKKEKKEKTVRALDFSFLLFSELEEGLPKKIKTKIFSNAELSEPSRVP